VDVIPSNQYFPYGGPSSSALARENGTAATACQLMILLTLYLIVSALNDGGSGMGMAFLLVKKCAPSLSYRSFLVIS